MVNKKDKPYSHFIMVNSPAPLEVMEMVVDELHAHREGAGLDPEDVEIQVEAINDHGMLLMKISMTEK